MANFVFVKISNRLNYFALVNQLLNSIYTVMVSFYSIRVLGSASFYGIWINSALA